MKRSERAPNRINATSIIGWEDGSFPSSFPRHFPRVFPVGSRTKDPCRLDLMGGCTVTLTYPHVLYKSLNFAEKKSNEGFTIMVNDLESYKVVSFWLVPLTKMRCSYVGCPLEPAL